MDEISIALGDIIKPIDVIIFSLTNSPTGKGEKETNSINSERGEFTY